MNAKIQSARLDRLFEAVLRLEKIDECYNFFEDLCTVPELKALTQRFHVAELLVSGMVYSDIVKATGASSATISRVNRALNLGSDGYKNVIGKLAAGKK